MLRTPGVAVGLGSACGARAKKGVNWHLESASAMALCCPDTCLKITVKLCRAAVRNSILSSNTTHGSLDDLPCQASTIA